MLAEVQELVGPDIEIVVMHRDIGLENDVRRPARRRRSADTLDRHDPGAPVLPYLLSGGTDNKALSASSASPATASRRCKLPAELDFPAMFHGVDERVPLDALVFGRQVLTDLLLHY